MVTFLMIVYGLLTPNLQSLVGKVFVLWI